MSSEADQACATRLYAVARSFEERTGFLFLSVEDIYENPDMLYASKTVSPNY